VRHRRRTNIHGTQFGFRPKKGTTDAIFIVSQMQERYFLQNKERWLAFMDFEKAFDSVLRVVLW